MAARLDVPKMATATKGMMCAVKASSFCGRALDLLKRHWGIVWDPGRFRGIAPRRRREENWGTLRAHPPSA